jgi:hypothetical protein
MLLRRRNSRIDMVWPTPLPGPLSVDVFQSREADRLPRGASALIVGEDDIKLPRSGPSTVPLVLKKGDRFFEVSSKSGPISVILLSFV